MAYIQVDFNEAIQYLSAVKSVAVSQETGELSEFGRRSLQQIAIHIFGLDPGEAERASLLKPEQLEILCGDDEANSLRVLEIISIAALIEGVRDEQGQIIPQRVDVARLKHALEFAAALSIDNEFAVAMQLLIDGDFEAFSQMYTVRNFESVFHLKYDSVENTDTILLPYRASPDRVLLERYQSLKEYPERSLGKAFWHLYVDNNYKFPGDPEALVEGFAAPHDSLHILAGYNTKFSGEILVSTCTAKMHDIFPLSGHVFAVVPIWHLGFTSTVEINLKAVGRLVVERFWEAYARGAAMLVDTFDPAWDFWAVAEENLDDLRHQYGLLPLAPGEKAGLL